MHHLKPLLLSVIVTCLLSLTIGYFWGQSRQSPIHQTVESRVVQLKEESAIVGVVKKASPAVVSIIVTKDLPKIKRYRVNPFGNFFGGYGFPLYRQEGSEKREIGGGTGFLVSRDGYIVSNKHVVADPRAEYTVLFNNEDKYTAQVLARDPLNDLAILKIDGEDFPYLELGDSDHIDVGQTVVAIGNALAEFRNTVSQGIVSGLARSLSAGDGSYQSDFLTGLIQTDASINPGNSGGPLLNVASQVIGINTAIVQGAQNIGFAIPVNSVKNIIESVKRYGRIVRPWLGIRYVPITPLLKEQYKLPVDYGALIAGDRRQSGVVPRSPAHKAGLKSGDIILSINNKPINNENPLVHVVGKLSPGDVITLSILRDNQQIPLTVKLEEMKSFTP